MRLKPIPLMVGMAFMTSSGHAFVDTGNGGGIAQRNGPAFVCTTFANNKRARSQAHGISCGMRFVDKHGTLRGGPSLTAVVTRRGVVRCVARGTLGLEDQNCFSLDGPSCGVGKMHFCFSPGLGQASATPVNQDSEVPAPVPAMMGPPVGRLVRNGRVFCLAISNAELLRYEPTAVRRDIIACGRSDTGYISFSLFEGANVPFAGDATLDLATGCVDPSLLERTPIPASLPICIR